MKPIIKSERLRGEKIGARVVVDIDHDGIELLAIRNGFPWSCQPVDHGLIELLYSVIGEFLGKGEIESHIYKYTDNFLLVNGPYPHQQHPNQQDGLDMYVDLINRNTNEKCCKKLYSNGKGLHFKHSGLPVTYMHDFVDDALYVPHQVIEKIT